MRLICLHVPACTLKESRWWDEDCEYLLVWEHEPEGLQEQWHCSVGLGCLPWPEGVARWELRLLEAHFPTLQNARPKGLPHYMISPALPQHKNSRLRLHILYLCTTHLSKYSHEKARMDIGNLVTLSLQSAHLAMWPADWSPNLALWFR